MIATVAAAVGLLLGYVLGLLTKPSRQEFSTCHGTSLVCSTCTGGGGHAAARPAQ